MFSEADEALSDLQQAMLKLAKEELKKFEDAEEGKPLPQTLVNLLIKTHAAILAHLSKRSGMDMAAIQKNPRAALAQLERQKMMIMKLIEQQESGALRVVGGHK